MEIKPILIIAAVLSALLWVGLCLLTALFTSWVFSDMRAGIWGIVAFTIVASLLVGCFSKKRIDDEHS